MSERVYLIITGLLLLIFLYMDVDILVYGYMGVLFFEGVTNLRIPKIIDLLRYGRKNQPPEVSNENYKVNFEAERALRLIVSVILFVTYSLIPNQAWFLPWFIGVMLTFAGVSKFCPMVMALKWIGLK